MGYITAEDAGNILKLRHVGSFLIRFHGSSPSILALNAINEVADILQYEIENFTPSLSNNMELKQQYKVTSPVLADIAWLRF